MPDSTPWRVGTGNLYFNGVPPYGAQPYCASLNSDTVAAKTPGEAVAQYLGMYTPQVIEQCLLDVSRVEQVSDCKVTATTPEVEQPFAWTIQNRPNSPYWNKRVIALPSCEVRLYSYFDPSAYALAPLPWRDTCSKGEVVVSPGGEVHCLRTDAHKEEKDRPEGSNCAGNPIDLSNGNKHQAAIDYTDAAGRLTFRRYYNSNIDGAGMLGRAWSSEYDARIYHSRDAVASGGVEAMTARRGSGAKINLHPSAGDLFVPNSSDIALNVQVRRNPDGTISGYTIVTTEGIEVFDARGLLRQLVDKDGYTRTLVHDADDRLVSVTDTSGRKLTFSYIHTISQKGFYIHKVTTPRGLEYEYAYNEVGPNARIQSVKQPSGKSVSYVYDGAYRLTGIVDELGVQFATFGYDANGDAIRTEHAGGADAVNVTRVLNADGSLSLSVDAAGVQTTRQYGKIGNRHVLISQSNPAGSGCTASTKTVDYDAKLNPVRVDDFDGKRVCTSYDDRRLRTAVVRGLTDAHQCTDVLPPASVLPAAAAKSSFQWHPSFEIPVRIAAPRTLTTMVYNGQPDPTNGQAIASCAPAQAVLPNGQPVAVLCKAVEQATLDLDGSKGFAAPLDPAVPKREVSYTYNAQGQMLTRKDARGFVTTFDYHPTTNGSVTAGDLRSVTPPKGLGRSNTAYNQDGFVLSSTDGNGLVTIYGYDLQNRPTQATVAGKTTSYTYDDKGRLIEVTGPAGEKATMVYDAADRLTEARDAHGNSVAYTLDVAGNVVREEYKDPAGLLKRWLERSFDALNRMQRSKGL